MEIGIKDIIDILAVAFLLFYVYRLMKESGSLNIFYGIFVFIVVWILVSQVFEMRLLGQIFDKLVSVGVLALIVLFQEEIRRFFLTIGSQRRSGFFFRLFKRRNNLFESQEAENKAVMQIVMACEQMSKKYVGALIVFERNMSLHDVISSGEKIDAAISSPLIQNIFFKNSPLHDGAMVIKDGRIDSAGCILPVSHNQNISKSLGLRHRAALGITQQSDATVIIISEETGGIAIAQRGELRLRASIEELESCLAALFR